MTPEQAQQLLDVAVRRQSVKLIVNALGTPPREQVARLKSMGFKVGLADRASADRVKGELGSGIDLLVAQGTEAGGQRPGSITSMVLGPQIVDLCRRSPRARGRRHRSRRTDGRGTGDGCGCVWCGSIWLGTRQSEVDPLVKERFYAAKSEDAIQTRALTGKPCRALRSKFLDAWEVKGAPSTLMLPLQTLVGLEARLRAQRGKAKVDDLPGRANRRRHDWRNVSARRGARNAGGVSRVGGTVESAGGGIALLGHEQLCFDSLSEDRRTD